MKRARIVRDYLAMKGAAVNLFLRKSPLRDSYPRVARDDHPIGAYRVGYVEYVHRFANQP